MTVEKVSGFMPVTNEALEDGPRIRETIAVAFAGTKPKTRYANVWREGYYAALDDIRRRRLVLEDGEFAIGFMS